MDRSLENLSNAGGPDPFNIHIKKYFFASNLAAVLLMSSFLSVSIIMSIGMLVQFSLILIFFSLLILGRSLFVKNHAHLIFAQQILTLLTTIFFVTRLGGLYTSGGIIFIGVAPVLKTLIFRNLKWTISVYSLFFVSIFLLLAFDGRFAGKELISTEQNLILFSVNLVIITTYAFIFALYSQNIYAKLERNEALRQKEINEAKSRLFTNITHEFRTPLTVILGVADSIKHNIGNGLEVKAETITRNGRNLLQLVDQMLELSKLESGKLTVNAIHGDIISFLRYIFQLQEYAAIDKQISYGFNAETLSCEMFFDPEKIATIVSNLLSNAIKFTPCGGKVNMKAGVSGDWLIMEIRDNGIGIPDDKKGRIFERFYQADDQDTRKAGGTGIGLAITHELVSLLEGDISFQSNPGNETVFTVKLPVASESSLKKDPWLDALTGIHAPGPVSQSSIQDHTPTAENKRSLLIIEDNQDVVNYLKACYSKHFLIDVAFDGRQGYEMAVEFVPDVIVSDIMMPEMDGYSLCRKLKDDYRTSHIPVILLTAKADMPSRINGLEQGADAFITKPFSQEELLVRINKLLELRKKLYHRYSNGEPGDNPDHPVLQREDKFFRKVRENVMKNLHDEEYNVQALCEAMSMSKSQLYRKFDALTNMPAAKYIRKLRMERARHLLLTTSMNISEIAYAVGIKTHSTFTEVFKEEFGYSPREYVHLFQGDHQ
jgi:signal transduction histidine kinase/DNA-binding response OmpR family regulator